MLWISATTILGATMTFSALAATSTNGNFDALVRDLVAVERVYYDHRTDDKPPFEQAVPRDAVEKLVRQDQAKEAVLKKVYGIEVTAAQVDDEARRMRLATQQPEIIGELLAALDNDPARLERAVALPRAVDRLLREQFNNDAALQSPTREEADRIRKQLLEVVRRGTNGLQTTLANPGSREPASTRVERLLAILKSSSLGRVSDMFLPPAVAGETNAPGRDAMDASRRFGTNAPAVSSLTNTTPAAKAEFGELPAAVLDILRNLLHEPGDVSPVVELPDGYLLCVVTGAVGDRVQAATLVIPKPPFEQWLNAQIAKLP